MKLTQILADQVSSLAQSRGLSYFNRGAVQALTAAGGGIEAVVIGSVRYDVHLEVKADRLVVSCTCPYFCDRLDTCKHIWAVLLAVEARSMALVAPGTQPGALEIEAIDVDDGLDDGARPAPRPAAPAPPPPPTPWRLLFDTITSGPPPPTYGSPSPPAPGQLLYVLDITASRRAGTLVVELMTRDRKTNGEWGRPKATTITERAIRAMAMDNERRVLERMLGARPYEQWSSGGDYNSSLARPRLTGSLVLEILPLLCATGRCVVRVLEPAISTTSPKVVATYLPVAWDDGAPWAFKVRIRCAEGDAGHVVDGGVGGGHVIDGWLARDAERMEIAAPLLLLADGILVTRTSAARLDHSGAFAWLEALRRTPSIAVPDRARLELIDALIAQGPPLAEAPAELRVEIVQSEPRPRLRLGRDPHRTDRLLADVSFDYDGTIVPAGARSVVLRTGEVPRASEATGASEANRAIRRNLEAEQRLLASLEHRGLRYEQRYDQRFEQRWEPQYDPRRPVLQLPARSLPKLVGELLGEGWHVEAEGRAYRRPGKPSLSVSSGIDWFELHGEVSYEGHVVALPALLAALERGETFVKLDDGTIGMLPEEWLRTQATIAHFGSVEGDHLRFGSSQAALLDALLEAQPDVSWDENFARVRERLQDFDGIRPADAPETFVGELRPYQREGLGWFHFLEQFGFGGCLADDMGLGKTVMVLALLDRRRTEQPSDDRRPSLVVVPRSLVFNWREEARRFTPALRVLDYSGTARAELQARFEEVDVVLTTYGTLRRDAARLAGFAFDYVVLDEAQAIKNAETAAAKACRLLTGRHRLALSGTPVENHLGELGSLFEFLNPGLLGRTAFARLDRAGGIDQPQLELLARGLRPFILRRTKQQVASELPSKTEQTILCELEPPQRALYDELLRHYRSTLLARVGEQGLGRTKLQILEALLRLRQAACHPGLIDVARSDDSSAKLDVLVPRILEAVEEGHKTLVFSQFTSFLAILRARLDEQGVIYEYLDGRTRDRETRVTRFQTDEDCRLFLISLKAGGLGLNLTAAEYVFLLDPWWNPAVEAQAIDRAHRIGQARHVFAYRLIARDTVEERVLELQQSKRHLAEAILQADGSVIRDLRREDLELLLS